MCAFIMINFPLKSDNDITTVLAEYIYIVIKPTAISSFKHIIVRTHIFVYREFNANQVIP